MNKEEAKRLIRETFQNHFDESRFRLFAKNLFNDLDESKAFAYQGSTSPTPTRIMSASTSASANTPTRKGLPWTSSSST